MTDDNIEEIFASNELFDYIRGEKRYKNGRPEVDYARWRNISNYLEEDNNSNVRNKVVNLLLELLESKNWQDLYAVAGIFLDIKSPDIDKKFEQIMLDSRFFNLPDSPVSFISKYAMKKRLDSVTKSVVENAIKKNHIDWVVTLVSSNLGEQEVYWSYCDKIIDDILLKMKQAEREQVLEKVSFWKNRIMKIIAQLNKESV